MDVSLADEFIEEDWRRLRELGFRKAAEAYEPRYFGNSYVDLVNDDLLVRFTRDRGQYIADVASHADPEGWLPFWRLLDLLQEPCSDILPRDDGLELHPCVMEFLDNYERVVELMRPEQYPQTKHSLEDVKPRWLEA